MNSRHLVQFFASLILCTMASGCFAPSKQGSAPPATPPLDKSPSLTTHPDGMDASSESPVDVVARRMQEYSRSMEPAIVNRAPAVQPSQLSVVQWLDSDELRLSASPPHSPPHDPPHDLPADQDAQVARAMIESSPSAANQPAVALAPAPKPEPVISAQPTPPPTLPKAEPVESADALSEKLASHIREYPHDVPGQLDYQLLQYLLDQPASNDAAMTSLPSEDRELIKAVVDGLSNFRSNLRADSNMLLSRKVQPLLEMADRLRSQADLTIPTVALCTSVRCFGNYEPWPGDPPKFVAGVEHPVILYCEVQNFSSQLDENKMWQTQLTQDAVLYTEGGMAVWNDNTQTVTDASRNRRQDFFVVQRLKLPSTLQIGRYVLKVSIVDKQVKRMKEASMPLLVVAQ